MKCDIIIINIMHISIANVLPYITHNINVSTLQEEAYYYFMFENVILVSEIRRPTHLDRIVESSLWLNNLT